MLARCEILVIDDDDVDVEFVRRAFRREQPDSIIQEAKDGTEGLERLRAAGVEKTIVFLDLNMPKCDGFEFLQMVRSDDELRRAVVFVLTTSDNEIDKAKAYDHGIAGYIVKSQAGVDYRALPDLVRSYNETVAMPPRRPN